MRIIKFFRKHGITILLVLVIGYLVLNNKSGEKQNDVLLPTTDIGAMILPQPKAVAVSSGAITFCLRLNKSESMHLPALMGDEARDSYPNGKSDGSNWGLFPNATGEEDRGVLEDGTVFAKKAFLEKWGMTDCVELKSEKGGLKSGKDAWFPVIMEEVVINGEAAYAHNYIY
ncbi:MAG TPA: hypothetical protein VFD51_01025 [Patescibacteria group bacterium]|nr:hypothetical protein [Patescibacteria group bacterium]